jgi:3-hydroxy acid dehydrogenase/malonic semialdehyde reductase
MRRRYLLQLNDMQLKNKIVFITGASSGIGRSCAFAFAEQGAKLLLCARRSDRLEKVRNDLEAKFPGIVIHTFELDVRDREAVDEMLSSLPEEWKQIDILVNNAGLSRGLDKLQDGSIDDWEEMLDTNVKGLLYVTRTVVPWMLTRGNGHIINIGSIAGHEVYPRGNVYCASKFAVDALTKGLRLDLVDTPLRVSTVDPGLVETEFSMVRFHGDEERAKAVYKGFTPLSPDDVAESVLWIASRPAHVQIAEIVIFPTAQGSAAVVNRT